MLSPTMAPALQDSSSKKKKSGGTNVGMIAGIVAAAVVVLLICICLACFAMRSKRESDPDETKLHVQNPHSEVELYEKSDERKV